MSAPPLGKLLGVRDAAIYAGVTEHFMRAIIGRRELTVIRNAHGRLTGIFEAHIRQWQAAWQEPAVGPARGGAGRLDEVAARRATPRHAFVAASRFD